MPNSEQKAEPNPLCMKAWPPARRETHQPAAASVHFPEGHGDAYHYRCAGGICGCVLGYVSVCVEQKSLSTW